MVEVRELDLDPASLRMVQEILSRHVPDRPVFAFGSRARGKARRRSDLDLAVGGTGSIGLEVIANLKEDFSESDLPIFVDVLDIHSIDPGFLERIQRDFIAVPSVNLLRD
jgi:predicted nucleotidyltransferase